MFEISSMASLRLFSGETTGTSSPFLIISSTFASLIPNFPPGCSFAKSSLEKPLTFIKAAARASPNAKVAVVDVVGAKFRGQASFLTFRLSVRSDSLESVESGLLVTAITGMPKLFMRGITLRSSAVSPLLETAITVSSPFSIPRSP